MHDPTNDLRHDPLNRADPEPDWAGQIPFDGEPSPDADTAAFLRLVAGGTPRAEAAAIIDAGYLPEGAWNELHTEAA